MSSTSAHPTRWSLLAGLLCVAASACGSGGAQTTAGLKSEADATAVDADDDGAGDQDTWFTPAAKLPGPCSTALVDANGKVTEDYLRYEYDEQGRKTKEFTWEDVKKYTYTHSWTWDAEGRLAAETFETSGPEPNFDFKYQRDAAGTLLKKTGTMTGYIDVQCTYEHKGKGGKVSLELCARTWELKDDEGNVTGTDSDKYMVVYTYGPKMVTEEHGPLGMSSPDKTVWRTYDDQGRLIKLEYDYSTRGYAEEATYYAYGDDGRLHTKKWDQEADGVFESTVTYAWDAHGNALGEDMTQAPSFPASTWDPQSLEATPHGLRHRYGCWKGK